MLISSNGVVTKSSTNGSLQMKFAPELIPGLLWRFMMGNEAMIDEANQAPEYTQTVTNLVTGNLP